MHFVLDIDRSLPVRPDFPDYVKIETFDNVKFVFILPDGQNLEGILYGDGFQINIINNIQAKYGESVFNITGTLSSEIVHSIKYEPSPKYLCYKEVSLHVTG